jgi:glycosyltransferase involved in cell wall biosynthesis
MNILFFTFWYPNPSVPYKSIFVKEHAKAIKLAGVNITVLVFDIEKSNRLFNKRFEKFVDENGIPTHIIHVESLFYKFIYAFPPLAYIITSSYFKKNILVGGSLDFIHSNVIAPCGIVGYWLSKKYSIPHIITEHWSKMDKFMRLNIFSYAAKRAYLKALCITVVSDFLEKMVSKYAPKDKKIVIIPNVVNTNIFCYSPKIETGTLNFTAIATWTPPKLPFLIVEALNEVSLKTKQNIELNIVGEGSQIEKLKDLSSSLNYKINLIGRLSKEEIAKLLNRTDYFVHASEIETFSVVVAEALCTGTPVIASDVGALPELVKPPVNGVLCTNNPQEWVNGITKALSIEFDHKAISSAISDKVALKPVGVKFLSVYNAVINR